MQNLRRFLTCGVLVVAICASALTLSSIVYPSRASAVTRDPASSFSPYVSDSGAISRPTDFRVNWSHLGNWMVPDEETPQFHEVYTDANTVAHYRQTGEFPDGATLVKEVRAVDDMDMTTGHPSWASDNILWFVMVKDAQGRFAENPNWGEGWGWALFKADNPAQNVSTDFQADCLGCHIPAQETDYIYSFAYPTLAQQAAQ